MELYELSMETIIFVISYHNSHLSSTENISTISLNGTKRVGPLLFADTQCIMVKKWGFSTVFPSTCHPSVPWYIKPSFGSLEKYPKRGSGTLGWN